MRTFPRLIAIALLLAPDCTSRAADPPPQPTTMKFTRLGVKDPGINNIEAVSFLIPAGWEARGGVQWFPDYAILANLLMTITDPATGAAIEFLPVQHFTHLTQSVVPMAPGTNYLGMIVGPLPRDVPQFIQTWYLPTALKRLANVQPTKSEDLKKVAEAVAQSYGGQSQVLASRVRYAYEANGKPWEEDVYVTLVFTPWQGGTMWSVHSGHSFRAPQGQLDRLTPQMATTTSTLRLSQDWFGGYMYVQQLFQNRMNQSIRNAAAISATVTRNSEEIRQMFSESYRKANESQDRISRNFSEYVRGVETYKNPYEDRPIQLPAGYRDAWVNRGGEYILSTQAGFDPNVGSTVEWRRMEEPK